MAKIRHIALAVEDLHQTAAFYEQAFGLQRVRESKVAIMLTDGVVSLALMDVNRNANRGDSKPGLHHFGFLTEDLDVAGARIEAVGGQYHGQILGVGQGAATERKYRDPNGVVFDVVNDIHARNVWCLPQNDAQHEAESQAASAGA